MSRRPPKSREQLRQELREIIQRKRLPRVEAAIMMNVAPDTFLAWLKPDGSTSARPIPPDAPRRLKSATARLHARKPTPLERAERIIGSRAALARAARVPLRTYDAIKAGTTRMTPELAARIEKAVGGGVRKEELWSTPPLSREEIAALAPLDRAIHIAGGTTSALADKIGATKQLLSAIKNGKQPMSENVAAAISKATGVPRSQLRPES